MRCSRCGREFPSAYYFQADEICRECFANVPEAERAELLRHARSHGLHTSTTFQVDGYRVVKPLGLVRGITVRSRSIFGTLGGALQTIVGGNITMFTELCEKTRAEAFEILRPHGNEPERPAHRLRRRRLRRACGEGPPRTAAARGRPV